MSDEINRVRDPRTALVQEKYFTVRPKPLERWIWQQGLPQAAERVFWVHWEEGMRGGDWCSQLSLKRVASLCCVDPSTVTRAYQVLKQHGLIRREDPGRDPSNPFQQATAVTEVRLPRELLVELSRMPNRPQRATSGQGADAPHAERPIRSEPKKGQMMPVKVATHVTGTLIFAKSAAVHGVSGPERWVSRMSRWPTPMARSA